MSDELPGHQLLANHVADLPKALRPARHSISEPVTVSHRATSYVGLVRKPIRFRASARGPDND